MTAFLDMRIFQWQSVGHILANYAPSNAKQAASSSNAHAGKARDGGSRSARTDEHGGSERRRRQSKSKVVGGGLGMDSSEDIGSGRKQVHFDKTSASCDVAGSLKYRFCNDFTGNGIGVCCGKRHMLCSASCGEVG